MFFCWKCGKECSDGANFCGHCGNHFFGPIENITQKEYFKNYCSPSAKKRQLTINILSYIILAIHFLLFALLLCGNIAFFAFSFSLGTFGLASRSDLTAILPGALLLQTGIAGSFFFLLFGLRKNRIGFFITATVLNLLPLFAFSISLTESSFIHSLIILTILSAQILITVFGHKNNKEYKAFLKNTAAPIVDQSFNPANGGEPSSAEILPF